MELHQLPVYLFLMTISPCIKQVSGLTVMACESTSTDIDFTINLVNEGFAQKSWYFNLLGTKIADQIGIGNISILAPYTGRVSLYGSRGITLSGVTEADRGIYLIVYLTNITFTPGTASTTVNVLVRPNISCIPQVRTEAYFFRLGGYIPEDSKCPAKDLSLFWNDGQTSTSIFTCMTISNPSCCAKRTSGSLCYDGSLCNTNPCTGYLILLFLLIPIILFIIFIILICCGCLDCCKCCRIFGHYDENKCCYVTWFCLAKGCCSFFFCRPDSKKGKLFCGHESKKKRCGVCLACERKCRYDWPGCCKINKDRRCGCCICICCMQDIKDEGLTEVLTEDSTDITIATTRNRSPASHIGTLNRVNSENTGNQVKASELPFGGELQDKPKLRSQPTPWENKDIDKPQPRKLPPLQAANEITVEEKYDLEESRKKKKKTKKKQDVGN